ncbi:unnamed protein product [Caenorhabditis brenneri]
MDLFWIDSTDFQNEMLREDGATLELTDSRLISYFRSADGIVERRIAPQRDVENEPIENENVLAAVGAPIPTAQILMEPKREVAEALNSQDSQREVAGPVAPNLPAAPANPVPAQGSVEQNQESAGQTPASSQQEPTELTIPATTLLNNLCNMASAFHWSNDFGLTAQNEIQGRSSQKILKTKIQKVIESSHKALVDGASFNIPASKDSIQLVDFLRVYRTWLLMTDYNNFREIDDTMGQEIRDYDQREDGAPVKVSGTGNNGNNQYCVFSENPRVQALTRIATTKGPSLAKMDQAQYERAIAHHDTNLFLNSIVPISMKHKKNE